MIPKETISDRVKVKVNLVGNTMVGKTSILHRMRYGVFNPDPISTVGASFVSLKKDNINYEIWDTAGQERYLSLIPMYFRDVKIVLFVFDIDDSKSIKYINRYKDILSSDPITKIIVLGNKTDLTSNLSQEELENLLKELTSEVYNNFENAFLIDKLHGLYFISAKDGSGFDNFLEHFHECAKTLPLTDIRSKMIIDDIYVKREGDDGYIQIENKRCC
jgi:small GTP-binding protein